MKIKPIFLVMLVCLLTLSFVFVSCKTDDDGGGGGGKVPTELQGKWENDEYYIFFNADGFTISPTDYVTTIEMKVTSVSGTKVNWEHAQYGSPPSGSFDYVVASNTLTVTNETGSGNRMRNGTYTKQ
jgi:hypothetical protein